MRLIVAAIGRMKQGPDRELAERYQKRAADAGRALGLSGVDIIEIRESRAEPCGVIVDRKPNAHGDRPSPYCCDHQAAVLPLPKGLLGAVPTHSRVPAGLGSNLRRR